MYLLTFATLIIGLIAIYTQTISVQTQRIVAKQTGFAKAMMIWHGGAISMAASIISTNSSPGAYDAYMTSGCSLSYKVYGTATLCPAPTGGGISDAYGTVTTAAGVLNLIYTPSQTLVECVHIPAICTLPSGRNCSACTASYDLTDYQFYSVLYRDTTTNIDYVATFLPPATPSAANPPPSYLTMGNGNQAGFSQPDLMQQLKSSGMVSYVYGTVTTIGGQNKLIAYPFTYNVPSIVPAGSTVIISSPDGM